MSDRSYSAFVANVRERMTDREWSQSDLADALGVTPSYVSQLLSGHRRPGLDTLDEVAAVFDCEPADLIRSLQLVA
jgi:transcriptional regulator with XRE-family HTH domain